MFDIIYILAFNIQCRFCWHWAGTSHNPEMPLGLRNYFIIVHEDIVLSIGLENNTKERQIKIHDISEDVKVWFMQLIVWQPDQIELLFHTGVDMASSGVLLACMTIYYRQVSRLKLFCGLTAAGKYLRWRVKILIVVTWQRVVKCAAKS